MKMKTVDGELVAYMIPVDQGFDLAITPTTSAGAYAGGDIVGGLLTLENIALSDGGTVMLQEIQILVKSDVAPTWTIYLLDAPPTASVVADNGVFGLNVADLFSLKAILSFADLDGKAVDLGSIRAQWCDGLNKTMKCNEASRNLYALCVDGTGVTLGSVADVQFSFRGMSVS